jgi:hypothetical protein
MAGDKVLFLQISAIRGPFMCRVQCSPTSFWNTPRGQGPLKQIKKRNVLLRPIFDSEVSLSRAIGRIVWV